jgi:hypothetical protein
MTGPERDPEDHAAPTVDAGSIQVTHATTEGYSLKTNAKDNKTTTPPHPT